MTIGSIKMEALRLMFADLDPRMSAENLEDFENSDRVGDYLAMMTGSINRCLQNLVSRKILPERRRVLVLSEAERGGCAHHFDLSRIEDLYDVLRVTAESERGYDGDHPFLVEGRELLLLAPDEDTRYTLLYFPTVRAVETYENSRVLSEIPEELAVLIPYFIKGELYREDESAEAAEAMSWYEGRLSEWKGKRTEKQGRVHSVYAQVAL